MVMLLMFDAGRLLQKEVMLPAWMTKQQWQQAYQVTAVTARRVPRWHWVISSQGRSPAGQCRVALVARSRAAGRQAAGRVLLMGRHKPLGEACFEWGNQHSGVLMRVRLLTTKYG